MTHSEKVHLTFEPDLAPWKMKISNYPDFREAKWQPYQKEIDWILTGIKGATAVYFKFKTRNGTEVSGYNTIIMAASFSTTLAQKADFELIDLKENPTEKDYVVKIKDLKDGTFLIELFNHMYEALNNQAPVAYATSTATGVQTLILISNATPIAGTITVKLVKGAAEALFFYRHDVLDLTLGESLQPLVYKIEEDENYFYGKILRPVYDAKTIGKVYNVVFNDSNKTILDIEKTFTLIIDGYGFAQISLDNCSTDKQKENYPLQGARFLYPTLQVPANLTTIEEFSSFYRATIDQPISQFSDDFAFEMQFTQEQKYVTDYKIDKSDGTIILVNESGLATGDVKVEYEKTNTKNLPDDNFYHLSNLPCDAKIKIRIEQFTNRVPLAEVDSFRIRFYNGESGSSPQQVKFIINDTIKLIDKKYEVIDGYGKQGYGLACAYGYSSTYGYGYGYGKQTIGDDGQIVEFEALNTIKTEEPLDVIEIVFDVASPEMFIGEVRVFATSIPTESNCRVTVNGEEKYRSADSISSAFDTYEIVAQDGIVDFYCNNALITTQQIDFSGITTEIGAQARTIGDKVVADFANFTTKQYQKNKEITIDEDGRFVALEITQRKKNDDS